MFKRVILEDWHMVLPYLGFALIAGAFLVIVVRAVRIKKTEAERLAHLPLQDDADLKRKQ